jgi:hypothetical protein
MKYVNAYSIFGLITSRIVIINNRLVVLKKTHRTNVKREESTG